jgi:hypothetical protein
VERVNKRLNSLTAGLLLSLSLSLPVSAFMCLKGKQNFLLSAGATHQDKFLQLGVLYLQMT